MVQMLVFIFKHDKYYIKYIKYNTWKSESPTQRMIQMLVFIFKHDKYYKIYKI
jgi:hypothetical protein